MDIALIQPFSFIYVIIFIIGIAATIFSIRFYMFRSRRLKNLLKYPLVLVLGLPNSGKTSLIKALTNGSVIADPVKDNFEFSFVTYGGKNYQFCDFPYFLKDSKIDESGISEIKKLNPNLIIYLIDVSPFSDSIEAQINILNKIKSELKDVPVFIVANKVDSSDGRKIKELEEKLSEDIYRISLYTGDGIEKLKQAIFTTFHPKIKA